MCRFRGLKSLSVEKEWLSIDLLTKITKSWKFLSRVIIIVNEFHDSIIILRSEEAKPKFKVCFNSEAEPNEIYLSSWTEVIDYLDQNSLIKSHNFCDFFSENLHLDDLNIADYFYAQSH